MRLPIKQCLAGFLLLAFVTACGGGSDYGTASPYGGTDDPKSVRVGKPYTIAGERYYPTYDPSYDETGIASWYGPGFNGRMTASGERFDENEITAAHRTLPMPSIVRVTRTDTGKSIVVRINDRGPFAHGRIIDLSKGSAQALNMIGVGTAQVRVTYLPHETDQYIANLGIPRPEWMGTPNPNAARIAMPKPTRVEPVVPTLVPARAPFKKEGYQDSPFSIVDQ